jgi:heterodisulfide reductase subunit C
MLRSVVFLSTLLTAGEPWNRQNDAVVVLWEAGLIRYNAQEAGAFREGLLKRVKADVSACYQCGNCTAGCPAAFTFDYAPNQVMRMLQGGLVDEVLASRSVQLCLQCLTCTARCPRNIDIAGIFEDLKTIAVLRDLDGGENAQVFNRLFLENIAMWGRLSEAMFLLRYNLAIKRPLNDADLGMPMITKGKIDPIPKRAKGADEVSRIYKKSLEKAKCRG